MAVDFSALKNTLANSGMQTQNNALYQTIFNMISSLQSFQDDLDKAIKSINSELGIIGTINMIQVDTSGGPTTYNLDETVRDFTEFKDVGGNASGNPITLIGVVVDDTTDPVINTDYGSYKVFKASSGEFFTW